MQLNLSENYGKILRKIHAPSSGFVLKILAYLVALIYWGIILLATFSLLN